MKWDLHLKLVLIKGPCVTLPQIHMIVILLLRHLLLWIFVLALEFGSVQSLSRVRLFATPWIAARHASLSITNSRSSLRLTSIESVMPSSHLILCLPFSSRPQSLPASESVPMSQLFAWGDQSTGLSALASFLSKKFQTAWPIYSFPVASSSWNVKL